MRGVNKVILVGHLGNDPELKYTQGGTAVATLSLATTTSRKDRDGNMQEKTEWHRVKLWGKTAEVAGEYLKKGSQVYIEGRIEYGSYEKEGVNHYTTDIVGFDMQMLGGQRSRDDRNDRDPPRRESQRPQQDRRPAPRRQEPAPRYEDDFADDDIPF